MAFSEGSGDGGGKSFIRDQTADPGTWSQSQSVEMPSSPSRSPIPKVIGRGRGVALRSISSPVKRPISPHNMEGASASVGEGDGNPPLGIVKGRRANIEGNGGLGMALVAPASGPSSDGPTHPRHVPTKLPSATPTLVKSGSGGAVQTISSKSNAGGSSELKEEWQVEVDNRTGKPFYVNHQLKKWSWSPPSPRAAALPNGGIEASATVPVDESESAKVAEQAESEKEGAVPRIFPGGKDPESEIPSTLKNNSDDKCREDNVEAKGEEERKPGREIDETKENSAAHRRPVVPPLLMPVVHTPVKRTIPGDECNVIHDPVQAKSSPKSSRIQHDREVEELKSEIVLIRSQSKDPRRISHLDSSHNGAKVKAHDENVHALSKASSNGATKQVSGSSLMKIDISKIRQAPYISVENSIVPENAGETYRQVEAAQYSGRGNLVVPVGQKGSICSSSVPSGPSSGSLTARGRMETVTDGKVQLLAASHGPSPWNHSVEWQSAALDARSLLDSTVSALDPSSDSKHVHRLEGTLARLLKAGSTIFAMVAQGESFHRLPTGVSARDRNAYLKKHGNRECQISSPFEVHVDTTAANVEELLHEISSLRDQQTCLHKALKECVTIISSEMLQMQSKSQDYHTRSDQAIFCRNRVDLQLDEQRQEIMHTCKRILQPNIEDMVLIAQLNSVVEKLLISRENHSIQLENLKTSDQYLNEGRSFLQKVHVLLHDCVVNLESAQVNAHSLAKYLTQDRTFSIGSRSPNDSTAEDENVLKQDQDNNSSGEITAELVRVAAELEDVCMELNWMVGLISQLGEEAMNSSTSEGQHRSLLMQQEQMHGFKEVVERAVYKASNVMARVTSSLFLSPKGISEAQKEDFDKLSRSKVDKAPDSGNMWHQVRYQRDKTAWIEERDVMYTKLSQGQQEADSLRASLGSQSLKIHELREAVQALENEKTLQTSDYAKNTLELKRALEFERSMNTDKQSRIEKLEGLYDRERLHSERVVRQAVSTLQIMKQDGVLKPGNDQPILQNHAGLNSQDSLQSPLVERTNSVEITEQPRYHLHAQLIEQEQQMLTAVLLDNKQNTETAETPLQRRSSTGATRTSPGPRGSSSKNTSTASTTNTIHGTCKENGKPVNAPSTSHEDVLKPTRPTTSEIKLATGAPVANAGKDVGAGKASRIVSKPNLGPTGDLSGDYDDPTSGEDTDSSVEDVDSSKLSLFEGWDAKLSLFEGWDESIPADDDKKLENISSSSGTCSLSDMVSLYGSEQVPAKQPAALLPKNSAAGQDDPFERFRKWHARTSSPRGLIGRGTLECENQALPPVISWNPNTLPSEWLIRGRIIEAFNLPKTENNAAGSYICCFSLIQDLKGVAHNRYLSLDQKGLNMNSPEGRRIWIRPQHISRASIPSVHPVWEEEVTLADMHPNPMVLERLHAAGQLATSRERVLLSGLPVHVLVSVQIQEGSAEATSYRGHCFVEPGPARDVWVDLLDAQFKRLSSPRGKNASLLINLCYEPKNALSKISSPRPNPHFNATGPSVQTVAGDYIRDEWNRPMVPSQDSKDVAALC